MATAHPERTQLVASCAAAETSKSQMAREPATDNNW